MFDKKEYMKKYNASKKGKARDKKYQASEKGKKAKKKYFASKKGKEARKKYDASKKGKEARKKAKKKYYLKHPEKIKAQISTRKLPNKPCFIRGCNKKGEKHHEDYSKPLEVLYFCHQHHMQICHGKGG